MIAPRMALKVIAPEYGGPDVLRLVDEPVRAPGPDELVVRTRAIGTNPADYKQYTGAYGRDPARLPITPGMEAAGVVVAVGDEKGSFRTGDEVVLYRIERAYAEEVCVPFANAIAKPSKVPFEEAAGLLIVGTTAAHAITAARVAAGDTVVVHGGSGGVGHIAVQLAIAAGARVIATAGESSHEYLRQLGAEPVAYGAGLLERVRSLRAQGVDAAIDTVGTDEALDVSCELVSDRGRIVTIAAYRRGHELGVKVIGRDEDPGLELRFGARSWLLRDAEAGKLRLRIQSVYPLERVADAHRDLMSRHTHGKIVLTPARP
jgi:NADPH:quinone reductase